MNKTFCDICKREMTNMTEAGHLTIAKKMLLEAHPKVVRKELDLCDECINKVWDLLEKIKKEKNE